MKMVRHEINHRDSGFTLIELMVVIAIIGLLASTVLNSMSDARALARDTRRVNDMKEIQKGLELYRNANAGVYPVVPVNSQVQNMSTTLGQFMSDIPSDPVNTGSNGYRYYPSTDRNSYTLLFRPDVVKTNSVGQVIGPGYFSGWCSISFGGPGYPPWNGDANDGSGTNYPVCF